MNKTIYDVIINYIENNNYNYDIEYLKTIEELQEFLEELKKEYNQTEEERKEV